MKYRLIMSGTCFEGSAHILTTNEVLKIQEFKTENSFESLAEMHSELSWGFFLNKTSLESIYQKFLKSVLSFYF